MYKRRIIGLLWLATLPTTTVAEVQFSGPVGVEVRQFKQGEDKTQSSLYSLPKWQWQTGDSRYTLELFGRVDSLDDERTHADIREASWLYIMGDWEVKAGIGKVFWGVAETVHLVDIINQTDAIEAIDGEEKLGQPMVQLSLLQDWGAVDFFVLPYFRERTFPGEDGRLGPTLLVDIDNPTYESGAEEKHVDFALRYSKVLGDWDIGLSYFQGTNRDPHLEPSFTLAGDIELIPYYDQIKQVGLDVQSTIGAWLWKLEAIAREDSREEYAAAVAGFEYTLFGIVDSAVDWGIVVEFSRDSRGESSNFPGQKDIALANRITFNDIDGSEILFGVNQDLDEAERYSAFLEASRRFGNRIRVSLEGWLFDSDGPDDPVSQFRDEDYVQANLEYFF